MKALFIGLGSTGQRHLHNLKHLRPADLRLIAYRARNAPGLLTDRGEFDPAVDPAVHHGVEVCRSLGEALAMRPEVTFVTNPTAMHVPAAIAAVRAGSHVFVEKPLSDSTEGVDELLDAARAAGVVVAVGYQWRFHPALTCVKAWIDAGLAGRVVSAHLTNGEYMPGWHPYEDYRGTYGARRVLGGGAIATQSHELDCAIWLFGAPRSVFAAGGHLSDLEIDVEDVARLTLDFGGSRPLPVTIALDYLTRPSTKQISIVGTAATIRADLLACTASLTPVVGSDARSESWPAFQRNDMFLACLRAFLAAVAGDGPAIVPLGEAVMSVRTIDAARISLRDNRLVSC
jgi:predicted dehydrogenase